MKCQLELGMALSNKLNGSMLDTIFHAVELCAAEPNSEGELWTCRFTVTKNGNRESKAAYGASWLQALLLAVEYVRRQMPDEESQDWITSDSLPAWIVFPRTVDVGWGFEFYHNCVALLDANQKALQRSIELKREAKSL